MQDSTLPASSSQTKGESNRNSNSFRFQSGSLTLAKLSHIFSILKSTKPSFTKGAITCSDPEIINQLTQNFNRRLSHNLWFKKPCFASIGKQDLEIEDIKSKMYKKSIDLGTNIVLNIFSNQYRGTLLELGQQYNLYLVCDGSVIRVHSDYPISSVFQSQIVNMKQKLKWIVYADEQFYEKLKFSKLIADKLAQNKIKFILLGKARSVILHSSQASAQIINNTKKQYAYEALVLEFENEVQSRIVNRIYFRMLIYHCEPFLAKLTQNYQIPTQICWKKRGVIMHTKDPIFSKQPKLQLSQFLSRIIFIAYYNRKPLQHINYIRNNKPQSKCLQVMMSDIFVYTSWNTTKRIEPNQVVKVFQMFFRDLNQRSILKISFRTGGLVKGVLDRITDLAQKYKLFCQPLQFQQLNTQIAHVKFKSFLNKQAKVKQISQFLQQLITGRITDQQIPNQTQPQKFQSKQEKIQNKDKKQSNQLKNQEPQKSQNKIQSEDKNLKSQNNMDQNMSVQLQKQQIIQAINSFSYNFQAPTLINNTQNSEPIIISTAFLQKILIRGKKNRKLQQLMRQNFNLTCKVWNLSYSDSLNIDFNKIKQLQGKSCTISITKFPKLSLSRNISIGDEVQNVENQRTYYFASKLKQQDIIVLTHVAIFYGHDD